MCFFSQRLKVIEVPLDYYFSVVCHCVSILELPCEFCGEALLNASCCFISDVETLL
jgi:hypothetical protein